MKKADTTRTEREKDAITRQWCRAMDEILHGDKDAGIALLGSIQCGDLQWLADEETARKEFMDLLNGWAKHQCDGRRTVLQIVDRAVAAGDPRALEIQPKIRANPNYLRLQTVLAEKSRINANR